MELPTGYTSDGPARTARGMLVMRAIRAADGARVVISGTPGPVTPESSRRRLDAEAECYALFEDTIARASRVDEQRKSWLVLEGVAGLPIDTSQAWSLDEFWSLAPALTDELAKLHARDCVHGGLEGGCIWWDAADSVRVTPLGVVTVAQASKLGTLPPTSDTAPEFF